MIVGALTLGKVFMHTCAACPQVTACNEPLFVQDADQSIDQVQQRIATARRTFMSQFTAWCAYASAKGSRPPPAHLEELRVDPQAPKGANRHIGSGGFGSVHKFQR